MHNMTFGKFSVAKSCTKFYVMHARKLQQAPLYFSLSLIHVWHLQFTNIMLIFQKKYKHNLLVISSFARQLDILVSEFFGNILFLKNSFIG